MKSRGVDLFDISILPGLPTKQLLGLRDRLLRLEERSTQSDLEAHELKADTLYFKDDPRWHALHGAVVAELSSREHLPTGAERQARRAQQAQRRAIGARGVNIAWLLDVAAVGFSIANGHGDSIAAPSAVQMKQFLGDIDATDEEHGAAWLSTDEGYSLEWNGDGRLVLTRPDADEVWHLRDVSRDRALELWVALSEGKLADVEGGAWQHGNGYVVTPERRAQVRAWHHKQDREFYETLGEERASVPCRVDGCKRGAVEFSVLCRAHHFESVQKRPCPFHD